MELFSQELFSVSFIVLAVFTLLWFVIKFLRHVRIEKNIQALDKLPHDQKERIVNLYRRMISGENILLWVILVNFLLFLVAYLLLLDGDVRRFLLFVGLLLVMGYMHLVEDKLYKKKILRAIDKPTEREFHDQT